MIESSYNPYKQNGIFVGKAQSGKTTKAIALAKRLVESGRNVIVFTPHHTSAFIKLAPERVIHNLHDVHPNKLCIVIPLINSPEFYDGLCAKVMTYKNLVFMPDEIHNYTTKYKVENNFAFLLRNCNNYNIGYMAIFQRPAEVPNMVISNANHCWAFQMKLATDVKYFKALIGEKAERLSPITDNPLKPYHGLYGSDYGETEEFEP